VETSSIPICNYYINFMSYFGGSIDVAFNPISFETQ
jgi:hypothetical protein